MKAIIETDIEAFPVPNYVKVMKASGAVPSTETIGGSTIPLSHLSVDTLLLLCEMFKYEVFEKAEKKVPCKIGEVELL